MAGKTPPVTTTTRIAAVVGTAEWDGTRVAITVRRAIGLAIAAAKASGLRRLTWSTTRKMRACC
ncbi:hypothetical protein E2562_012501 [Oryza meyeriana var. granulata]|uniref:Uncharacterized protein n=1 Tax=Oryza meyeriana var. granulata TaxID=110450 RepID=A0A6G1BVK7_9ORYZ|nr:hypothetical protein E2562_012501 [Oryza meyeriana var. granulata]